MILALAPAIPDLFHWGPSFYQSVPLMRVLAFQQPLVGADMVLATALIALHKERLMMRVAVVAAVFNPVADWLLIPVFEQSFGNGVMAAAIVEMATEFLFLGGSIYLLPRDLLERGLLGTIARVLLAGAGMIAVAVLLLPVSLPLSVPSDVLKVRRPVLSSRGAA
jgi:Na+-driven multidrug efflux pump